MALLTLAVHVGGDEAGAMADRMDASAPQTHTLGSCTMVASGRPVHATESGLLAVGGTPLGRPEPERIGGWQDAARLYRDCDGAFFAVYWDAAARKLVIVSDFLGYQPIYMRHDAGGLRLATETKAFRGEPDLAAWGTMLTYGFTLGDQTLMQGVRRVPPGAVLVYDADSDSFTEEPHWHWPEPGGTVDHDDLLDSLRSSVRGHHGDGPTGTMLLSGGCDSRIILCLLDEAGHRPDAIIVSHRDELFDADARFASRIARRFGIDHEFHRPRADFFSTDAYLRYVIDSDAGTPSLYLFIAHVAQYCRPPVLWDGLMLGMTLGRSHMGGSGFADFMARETHGVDSITWRAARQLFRPEVFDALYDGDQTRSREEQSKYSDDHFGVLQFMVRNRCRNRIAINPYKVFARYATVHSPSVSRGFMELAARIPPEARADLKLYRSLFARAFPKALDVPFCTGGGVYPGRPGAPGFAIESARMKLHKFAQARPRLIRLLGLPSESFAYQPSRFADLNLLYQDDPHLAPRSELEAVDDPALRRATLRLLFHWRCWHWLHNGELFERIRGEARAAA